MARDGDSPLEERDVFDPSEGLVASADPLGGGVSNHVIRVRGRGRCLVSESPLRPRSWGKPAGDAPGVFTDPAGTSTGALEAVERRGRNER